MNYSFKMHFIILLLIITMAIVYENPATPLLSYFSKPEI